LYPYGDTRTETRSVYDDGDERAARWTLRLLAVALFVAVVGATLVLSLLSLEDEAPSATATTVPADTVVTTPAPPEIGPPAGVEVAGYVAGRKAALAALREERVAVVSLGKYYTQTQAKGLLGSLQLVALLVAPPGVGPSVVTGDLAAWTKSQTDATRAERDEIKKLIPTVTDPAFKAFYNEEVARLDKALKNFAVDSAMVFGFVVKGPAAALQALGAKADVRLVDVGDMAAPDPQAVYHGLRPEETAKAEEPPLRPV
jgi:hypothetical protein